jgi:hypothetical protein
MYVCMYVPGRHHIQTANVDPVPAVLQVCMYVCMCAQLTCVR